MEKCQTDEKNVKNRSDSFKNRTQSQTNRTIIQRVLYPIVEKTNNKANYEANTLKDDNSTVLFWAKELK